MLRFRLETFTFRELKIQATNLHILQAIDWCNILCFRIIYHLTWKLPYNTVINIESPTKSDLSIESITTVKHLLLCWPHSRFVSSSIFGSVAVTFEILNGIDLKAGVTSGKQSFTEQRIEGEWNRLIIFKAVWPLWKSGVLIFNLWILPSWGIVYEQRND